VTLLKSGSVWKKLVLDAKERGCFYDANEDKNLARAITTALVESEKLCILLSNDSILFREARWKVRRCMQYMFWWNFDFVLDLNLYEFTM